MAEPIHQGDEGQAVRDFQHHLNDRLRAKGEEPVPINGKAGPKLIERAAFAAWFLGALMETVKSVLEGTIPAGVQQIIADPDSREPAQLDRARERRGKPFPGAMGTMFDTSDDPGQTFHGLAVEAVAAYGNGKFANHAKAKAAFPNAHLLQIDVKGEHIGNAGDFEPGDMAIEHAGSWAKQRIGAGIHRPVIYFSVSRWPAIMQSLEAAGLSRGDVRIWTAHYTGKAHLCSSACDSGVTGSADATQWASPKPRPGTLPPEYHGRNLDVSMTAGDFWT
jgi:hypothetical protein